ncbi:MAG TPA: VOC family protein [Ideonella sp.]|uniref:VOC family protein n=1 Tax=Ideonella sp. TaxID=1929293 RepID=UPI002E34215F|nr:VOC family protein [Ideonella sp.]HEX5686168.1 VOC family protein [Ideonella sp.]
MLRLDHITVAALDLADGVAWAQERLGVEIPRGGEHPLMGTHNHLLRLADDLFLEVIAPDPAAAAPARARWFGLDSPATQQALASSPRLWTWVARTADLDQALREVTGSAGPAVRVTRGALSWLIGVPDDGSMPFDGAFPTLIEWPPGPHPASRMVGRGCSLLRFTVHHPQADRIAAQLEPRLSDPRVRFEPGPTCRLVAEIQTPNGVRVLDQ